MTSMYEHEHGKGEELARPADATTVNVGQRRAAAWRSMEPSVARRTATDVLVGVVHTSDSVRFIAVARDDDALLRQLASYVAANARDRLWIADATNVLGMLAARDFEAAVRAYFTATDAPWDKDWLVIEAVP